jgi:hypothetical protein
MKRANDRSNRKGKIECQIHPNTIMAAKYACSGEAQGWRRPTKKGESYLLRMLKEGRINSGNV